MSYLFEQGRGQVALEWNSINNQDVLNSNEYPEDIKKKILIIQKARAYFYKYFDKKETTIYTNTTFLKSDAVTYLVIASKKNEIKPLRTSFPLYGSFPYLGFFSKKSAQEFASEKRDEGYHTYVRAVYAYSTLNQWIFSDNILSSFFHFTEEQLVDLVFHELVHTIIFVKNEVEFNENLAQHIAQQMTHEYLNYSETQILKRKNEKEKYKKLNQIIIAEIKNLNRKYKTSRDVKSTLEQFLLNDFLPKMKTFCKENQLINCWPIKVKWNNARFAALGTYESKRGDLKKLQKDLKLNTKNFFLYIEKQHNKYQAKENITFLNWLIERN